MMHIIEIPKPNPPRITLAQNACFSPVIPKMTEPKRKMKNKPRAQMISSQPII
jgi:hypothetical protein